MTIASTVTIFTHDHLEDIAKQRDQNYENESTAYIFEDGSAVVLHAYGEDAEVVENYGLHADNEVL